MIKLKLPEDGKGAIYLINGKEEIDIGYLTEEQIVEIIIRDIKDYYSKNGYYRNNGIEKLDALAFVELLNWSFSYDALLSLMDLELEMSHLYDVNIIKELIKKLDKKNIREMAKVVAKCRKEFYRDFTPVKIEEEMTAIRQLKYDEMDVESKESVQML